MVAARPLPNYLKTYRKRSSFTQREVAFLLGCKHGSKVSRYERGERVPSLRTVLACELVFRALARDLFAGTHQGVSAELRDRARELFKELDLKPFTPVVKRKLDSLDEVIHPPRSEREHHVA